MFKMSRLWHDQEGQDLLEYGLLLALIALVALASLQGFGAAVSDMFVNTTKDVQTVTS